MKQISGNRLLVNALKEEGVEVVFGYPGACTIDISDELYRQNDIAVVLPRHEQALAHEADAYARTTGKVGVCLVTSGPGATNLVTGLATAVNELSDAHQHTGAADEVDRIIQPVEELGREAGEQILTRVEQPDAPVAERVLTSVYRPYGEQET